MGSESYKEISAIESRLKIGASSILSKLGFVVCLFAIVYVMSVGAMLGKENLNNCLSYVLSSQQAHLRNLENLNYYSHGKKYRYRVENYKAIDALKRSVELFESRSIVALIIALILSVIAYRWFFGMVSKKSKSEAFIRGGELTDQKTLASILKREIGSKKAEKDLIHVDDIPIPRERESRHFMLTGDTGVGKSMQILEMMSTIRGRGKKALIWDKSGELTQHFFREGDVVLNPLDERCPNWSVYHEAKEIYEFESIAESFIPSDGDGKNAHWIEAPRSVFAWLFYRLKKKRGGTPTVDEVLKVLIASEKVVVKNELDQDVIVIKRELDELISGSLAQVVINPDSPVHASDVISSMMPKIKSLWFLRGLEKKERFSLTDWVENESDTRWVFIRANEKQLTSVRPLITAWLDIAIGAVLSLEKSREREVWCFLDELQSLDKLSSLERALFEGRKHGLRMVLGFTSIAKMYTLYQKDGFKAMSSMCGTKLFYRVSEPDLAEWVSKSLFEKEIISENKSVQSGTNSDSMGTSEHRERLALVSKDEIGLLNDFEFYLRLPGNYPIAKIVSSWKDWPIVAKAQITRELPEEIDYMSMGVTRNESSAVDDEEVLSAEDSGKPESPRWML